MKQNIHDHACTNCFTGKGSCLGNCNIQDENKQISLAAIQEFFPNGGRDWDQIVALYDAICAGKIPGVQIVNENSSRIEMIGYIKTAIGEGYQPEHDAAISDLCVIDGLDNQSLNREYGKCWQWYNMGGGIHELFS